METLQAYLQEPVGDAVPFEVPHDDGTQLRGTHYQRALQGFQSLKTCKRPYVSAVHLGAQASQHVLALDAYLGAKHKWNWRVLAPIPLDHLSASVAINDDVLYCTHEEKWCAAPWWESAQAMQAARMWLTGSGPLTPAVLASRLPDVVTLIGDRNAMRAFITVAKLLRRGGDLIITGAIDPALWSLCAQCFAQLDVGPQLLVASRFHSVPPVVLSTLEERVYSSASPHVLCERWIRAHTPHALHPGTHEFPVCSPRVGRYTNIQEPTVRYADDATESPAAAPVAEENRDDVAGPNAKRRKTDKKDDDPYFAVGDDDMRRLRVVLQEAKGLIHPAFTYPADTRPVCSPFTSNWGAVPGYTEAEEVPFPLSAPFAEALEAHADVETQRVFTRGLDSWAIDELFTQCDTEADLALVRPANSGMDLITSAIIALKALRQGGDLILRFPWRIRTMFEAGFFLLLAACFKKVQLWHPRTDNVRFFHGVKTNSLPSLAQLEALATQIPNGDLIPVSSCVSARCFSPFGALRQYLISHEWRHAVARVENQLRFFSINGFKKWIFPNAPRRKVWVACGSFDPVHENHIRVALWALKNYQARHVFFVTNTETNPYKVHATDAQIRSELIRARIRALEEAGEIQAGQIQVSAFLMADSNWPAREAFAAHLERELFQDEEELAEVGFLIGQDSFEKSYQSGTKHKNTGLFNLTKRPRPIIVFPRADHKDVYLPERFRHCMQIATGYSEERMSSSEIRMAISSGSRTSETMLHPSVMDLIAEKGLYQKIDDKADLVQTFYDEQAKRSVDRKDVVGLAFRNVNNFGKAVIIERALSMARINTGATGPLAVLDIGCGKGGDFRKFQNAGVGAYVGVDAAKQPLMTAVKRVEEAMNDAERAKHGDLKDKCDTKTAIFVQRDYTEPLGLQGDAQDLKFHAVCAQMTIHYAFTSESKVRTLLNNVSERLVRGGVFFGSLPDADAIIRRIPSVKPHEVTEQHCTLRFATDQFAKLQKWPHKCYDVLYSYIFPGAVDLPEPLAHFPTFIKLAAEYELQLTLGPTPLNRVVTEALSEGGGDVGRLKRLYFYKGGMADISTDQLSLYCVFAFTKVGTVDEVECKDVVAQIARARPGVRVIS